MNDFISSKFFIFVTLIWRNFYFILKDYKFNEDKSFDSTKKPQSNLN